MNERDKILGRIREALKIPAPQPNHAPIGSPTEAPAPGQFRQWLPRVGPGFEERLALFGSNASSLKAEFHLSDSQKELLNRLVEIGTVAGWKRVASHRGPLTDPAVRALGLPVCLTDEGYQVNDMEGCDVGISECDALVAQTGSVLVTSRSAGGRALSVLPPHHLVLARREQLVADLSDAFALLKHKYGSNFPSLISFITGPSRTGDIERILVLGAHGPRKLTVLCY